MASEGAVQRVLVPAYAKQLSPATQLAIQRATSETGLENGSKLPPPRPEDMLSAAAALEGALEEPGPAATGELRHSLGFTPSPCRTRGSGQKNSRRKRDLVLSVSELRFSKFFFRLEREVKSEVGVDFKHPLSNEWYPELLWSGRGEKTKPQGQIVPCYLRNFLRFFFFFFKIE